MKNEAQSTNQRKSHRERKNPGERDRQDERRRAKNAARRCQPRLIVCTDPIIYVPIRREA